MRLSVVAVALLAPAASAAPPVDFNRDVRPILSGSCYACHGPDAKARKAGLRLDDRAAAVKAEAFKPGDAAASELVRRLTAADPDERMPPASSKKPALTKEQIDTLTRWVNEGAKYADHWAFAPIAKPTPPIPSDPAWAKHPVDAFVWYRLDQEGLKPSPEADRVTLLRRLSFDLTGLPPTPEQVRAFVADTSPDAFEKQVDRLLASPHFGERMAVWWLDLVRYADSIGYHSDNPMNVSPYRDYVIRAFNTNKPFDRFTVEQLAGDLLPNPTTEQRVASAYNRLLQTTEEGGAQPREYEAKYAADRVRNYGQVWLGGTLMCAECHNHKFDPYTQKDFYSIAAFFADVQEAAVGRREPGMPVPTTDGQAALDKLDTALASARAKLNAPSPELAAAQKEWEAKVRQPVEWTTLEPETWRVQGESKLEKQPGGVLRSFYKVAANETVTVKAKLPAGAWVTGFRLDVLPDDKLPSKGPGNAPNGNFVLTRVLVEAGGERVKLTKASADFAQQGFAADGVLDEKTDTGWAILGGVGKPHHLIVEPAAPITFEKETAVTIELQFHSKHPQHSIGQFRLSYTTAAEPARAALPATVTDALTVPADKRNSQQAEAVTAHYRTVAPLLRPLHDDIKRLEAERTKLLDSFPKVLVTTAGPPRTVRVLHRGNWLDDKGEVVAPATPKFLPPLPTTSGRPTRLDLARWTVSADNPLTARVTANRLWKLAFGAGLSRSLEESGSQGDPPTHPELLDFLASEFKRDWDVKRLLRLMVTSKAYRQSSKESPALRERDPANRLLARQARYRLDAEFVRDTALAVSGLLADEVGGPSVKPYQPAGYWAALNFPVREWQNDSGTRLHRRGMYTHWQRSFPHPSMVAFDAPSREECTCDRPRSNIPQQALALLNDPGYVEAARVFATGAVKAAADDGKRLAWLFERATGRTPSADEAKVLAELLAGHRADYAKDADGAKKLLAVGATPAPADVLPAELAAWTSVARAVLNLHETITRP